MYFEFLLLSNNKGVIIFTIYQRFSDGRKMEGGRYELIDFRIYNSNENSIKGTKINLILKNLFVNKLS